MEPSPAVKTFNCPSCAGTIFVRASGQTTVVGCEHCGAILDVSNPDAREIAVYQERTRIKPLIPLGQRGTIRGETLEVLGFLRRRVAGTMYGWSEYLLWSPYVGYRWLTEYDGHWTFVKSCVATPARSLRNAQYRNWTFRLFQCSRGEVVYVIGEFPWRVVRGEEATIQDFVAPPFMLSMEKTAGEVTWSVGEYVGGKEIWEGLKLPGEPPASRGVAPCQPSPYGPHRRKMALAFCGAVGLLLFIQVAALAMCRGKTALEQEFAMTAKDSEKSRVSDYFQLDGRSSNVGVDFSTDLVNNWAYFQGTLINEDTGTAVDFGEEVEFYSGWDSDGSWTEGSQSETVYLPAVPAGTYYLRVEPETPAAALRYRVRVRRDVATWRSFWLALVPVAIIYLAILALDLRFEYRRWAESDYPWIQSSSDSDD